MTGSEPPERQRGTPANWRTDRQRLLVAFLRAALAVVAVTAGAALVLPGAPAHEAALAMVVLLVAVPAVRVAWLAQRWFRLGDRVFSALAGGLLVVLVLAFLVAR